jgi:hypothetical protein
MHPIRSTSALLAALVAVLLLSACDAPTTRPPDSRRGASASPVRIPLPTNEVSGVRFADAESGLEARIAEACGGDQCVGIVRVNDDHAGNDTREECDVIDRVRDGATGVVEVDRGGDLVLVVRIRCEDVRGTGGGRDGRDGADGADGTGREGTGQDGADGEPG